MIVAVPAIAGVKTPELLIVPIFEGLTDHDTDDEKAPVPETVAEHVALWVTVIEDGEQEAVTDVMVGVVLPPPPLVPPLLPAPPHPQRATRTASVPAVSHPLLR